MAFKGAGRRYPGNPVSKRWRRRIQLARKCCTFGPCPRNEGCEENGAGGLGHILVNYDRESSVVMAGLSLGPRSSGAVNTVAASGNPSFAGPPLALQKGVRPGTSAGGAADK